MLLPVTPLLRTTATAASALMLACLPLAAQPSTMPPLRGTTQTQADNVRLKHLPAGRDELVFRGERTSRRWSIVLSRNEADRASAFQLALLNTVAVLPDRSSIKLTINGHVLSVTPVQSPDKVGIRTVKVPAGVLVPGANTVEVEVKLTHRVDCSVKATYELWAYLDPSQTGIVTENIALSSVRSLDDIAAEPLADDGTTRIHVRMADGAPPETIAQAARAVDALVRRSNLVRPVVDIGPDAGRGPGFDLVLTAGNAHDAAATPLRVGGRDNNVTLGRDPTTNRLVLLMSGSDGQDLDHLIAALGEVKPDSLTSRVSGGETAIDSGTRKTFSQLGLAAENFTGRHYLATAGVALPPDFYPSSYDKASLLIDGAHSASLAAGSELIFRVNGTLVSSKRLTAGMAERFQHDVVELPLRFFHPGHNEIAIEGITSSPIDQQCDLVTMPAEARLSIAGTSELEFPTFARFGTLPQIPASMSLGTLVDGQLHVYLPGAEPSAIGTALTVMANMAARSTGPVLPVLHFATPAQGDVPGLLIASPEQLPENLATPLYRLAIASDEVVGTVQTPAPTTVNEAAGLNPARLADGWHGVVSRGQSLLRNRGFFFSSSDDRSSGLPLTGRSTLIGAVLPDAAALSIGTLELPRFTHNASQWLVITAKSDDVYEAGIARLVANGQWSALAGQAVSLDLDTNQLRSVQPSRITYVVPEHFVFSDVRPILGGVASNNMLLSLMTLVALMGILGVSTHVLVRRSGAK